MQIAAKRKRNALEKRENRIAFLFILLPVIGFCVFTIGSMIFTFVFSFTSFNKLTGEITALKNGIFGNYEKLFTSVSHSKFFIGSIKNTLILLLSIPFSMILGLVTAGLLKYLPLPVPPPSQWISRLNTLLIIPNSSLKIYLQTIFNATALDTVGT